MTDPFSAGAGGQDPFDPNAHLPFPEAGTARPQGGVPAQPQLNPGQPAQAVPAQPVQPAQSVQPAQAVQPAATDPFAVPGAAAQGWQQPQQQAPMPMGAQVPAQAPYGAPAAYGGAAARPVGPAYDAVRSQSIFALLCSIAGVTFVPLIGAIVGWVWGASLVSKATKLGMDKSEYSMARIAKYLGIAGVVICVLAALGGLAVAIIAAFTYPGS